MPEEADELYKLPLDEFTRARDELVTELSDRGDKESAAQVKKLKKPSLAAWAVNQLVHQHPELIERLLDLRERIENSTNANDMRAASEERRRLIAELVSKAEAILTKSGHAASANTVQAITQTLHAGDDDEERELLRHGRLTRELTPSGFGGFGGSFEAAKEDEADDPRLEKKRAQAESLEQEADEAEAEAADADRAVAEAERALKRVQVLAEKARRAAEQARARAIKARDEVR